MLICFEADLKEEEAYETSSFSIFSSESIDFYGEADFDDILGSFSLATVISFIYFSKP